MHGKDGSDLLILGKPHILLPEEHGDKRCMPVVAVDQYRGNIRNMLQALQDRLAEKGDPFRIIIVAVRERPLEIVFVIYKIEGDSLFAEDFNPAVLLPPAERNGKFRDFFHPVFVFTGNAFKLGKHNPLSLIHILSITGISHPHSAIFSMILSASAGGSCAPSSQ